MSDEFLIRLFKRHFSDPVAALRRLDAHLASGSLSFDVKAQLRELPFPPQPNLPNGLPSFIYYFVPDSQRGTDQWTSTDPLHPSFLNASDGIGLNLGCPVRLLRALDTLAQLTTEDQREPWDALRNNRQHLTAVEEILWLSGWKGASRLRRAGQFNGLSGDVDWAFEAQGYPIFLEAKFRRSDWPRLTDGGEFALAGQGFLSSATHKFPEPPQAAALHIVGITTFTNIDEQVVNLIGQELEAAPQIHAVVIRSLLQMTHVLSLSVEIRDRILGLLATPKMADFPINYVVLFHREQRDQRVAQRTGGNSVNTTSRVVCWSLQPEGRLPFAPPEPSFYRLEIPSRGTYGEPRFQVIPKYIMTPTI